MSSANSTFSTVSLVDIDISHACETRFVARAGRVVHPSVGGRRHQAVKRVAFAPAKAAPVVKQAAVPHFEAPLFPRIRFAVPAARVFATPVRRWRCVPLFRVREAEWYGAKGGARREAGSI